MNNTEVDDEEAQQVGFYYIQPLLSKLKTE